MQTLQRFTDLMHLTISLEKVILIQESGFIGLLSVTFGNDGIDCVCIVRVNVYMYKCAHALVCI